MTKVARKKLMQKQKALVKTSAGAADAERKSVSELKKAHKELRKAQKKLAMTQKLATMGQLGGGVAHELNNPLTLILLGVQTISQKIRKEKAFVPDSHVYLKTLKKVEKAVKRCENIVSRLLAFSHPLGVSLSQADINSILDETLDYLKDRISPRVTVVRDFAKNLPIMTIDEQQLSEVFANLITNACESMINWGELRITTRVRKPGAGDDGIGKTGRIVEILFRDTGKGISKDNQEKIFDPFFTTKEAGGGVGLGLSVSRGILEQHGGTIQVKSRKGRGSTFIVRLPVRNLREY